MGTLRKLLSIATSCAALLSVPLAIMAAGGSVGRGTDTTLLHVGTLIAVPGEAPAMEQTVLIRNGRIVAIQPGFQSARVFGLSSEIKPVDLTRHVVVPGFIDLHVHLTSEVAPGGPLREITRTDADLAFVAAMHARRTLAAGVTTVLDLGTGRRAHEQAIYALRYAVASGWTEGPRILSAGSPLSAPGSSRTASFRPEVETVLAPQGVCSGPEDCRREVREQVRRGADVISFYNSGSLLLAPRSPAQTFTDEEMQVIVETAHALGRKVLADGGNTAGDASGINAALRAGVDWIDTVSYPDSETWSLLKSRRAYFVPHVYALRAAVGDPAVPDDGTMPWLPPPVHEFLAGLVAEIPSAVPGLNAGAKFAMGSDAGVFPHGDNMRELIELVALGMTPETALRAATVHAADALGRGDLGRLVPSANADLVGLKGNPLNDISQVVNVGFVMRDGIIYRNDP